MYKIASANLQSRNRVIDADVQARMAIRVEDDFIPTAANMSWEECESERRALVLEKTKMANELMAAKRARDRSLIEMLGLRQQTYDGRLAMIRQRQQDLRRGHEYEALRQAVNELVTDDERPAIFRRMREVLAELCRDA